MLLASTARCQRHRVVLASSSAAASPVVTPSVAPAVVKKGPRLRPSLLSWQTDALDAFWREQGVRSDAQRVRLVSLATERLLFRSPAELARRLSCLRTALWQAEGIRNADVALMVGRFPRLLCGDPDAKADKLMRLSDSLPGVRLASLLQSCPQVLSLDPKLVERRAQRLKLLLPACDALRMAELCPQLLTVTHEGTVAPALAALRDLLQRHGCRPGEAEYIAMAAPRLLTAAAATVGDRMELLERLRPGSAAALGGKPAALARLLTASDKALRRLQYLSETGLGDVRAPHAAAAEPPAAAQPPKRRVGRPAKGDAAPMMPPQAAEKKRRGTPPKPLGPTRVVSMAAAVFNARFPGFEAWHAELQSHVSAAV